MPGQRTLALISCAATLWALHAWAAPDAGSAAASSAGPDTGPDVHERARRHLKTGVTLYNEQNYESAIVEFTASFRELPSASALQNIALCQTKLFRYVDAIDTLEALQARFGAVLSDDEARGVQEALRNLSRLVGSVSFHVTPANATITLDGKQLTLQDLTHPIRLSSGEYRVLATAPGYVSAQPLLTVVGGESKSLSITLKSAVGTLSIRVNDEQAAIALDRFPLAFGSWTGTVAAGEHVVQVYKPGHIMMLTRIAMHTGERMELQLPVGPEQAAGQTPPGYELVGLAYRNGKNNGPLTDPQVGFFALASGADLGVLRSPDGFQADDDADVTGGFFGLRGGYRFGEHLALEALLESGSQSVSGTLREARSTYDLTTRRFGANVRLLLGGKTVRFSGAVGAGGVWHRLELADHMYSGTNSYLGIEVGPQLNANHVLIECMAQAFLDGANRAREGSTRIYTERTVLPQVGVALRVGFSQWGTW